MTLAKHPETLSLGGSAGVRSKRESKFYKRVFGYYNKKKIVLQTVVALKKPAEHLKASPAENVENLLFKSIKL